MRRVKTAIQTVSGLMTLADVLSTIGFWLYRGTMRRTVGMAIALFTVFVLSKKTTRFDVAFSTVVGGTGLILIGSCLGGALLMFISGSFSRSVLLVGEAKGINLLEDMKKARASIHCRRFWRRVFVYEQAICTPDQIGNETRVIRQHQAELDQLCHPSLSRAFSPEHRLRLEDIVASLGTTKLGWEIMFDHVMQLPLARSTLKHHFRYDVSKIKDWYDGAPFHKSDTKLQQQFDHAETLQEAKTEARLTRFFMLTHSRKRMFQSLWFRVITRAIQLRVSGACRRLDKAHAPFHFSPDQFLWPNAHTDDMIRRDVSQSALDDLVEFRQRVFQRVLSPEPELSHKLMQKAIYPNFEASTQLRRLFDPEYVAGDDVEQNWTEDMVRYNRAMTPEDRASARRRMFVQRTRREQEALNVYLKTHPELAVNGDPEALRALRIAVHIDRGGLQELLIGKTAHDHRSRWQRIGDRLAGRAPIRPTQPIEDVIAAVVAEKRQYTRKLLAVRIHHELTRNELEDYEHYVDRIMEGHASHEPEGFEQADDETAIDLAAVLDDAVTAEG